MSASTILLPFQPSSMSTVPAHLPIPVRSKSGSTKKM